MPVSRELGKVLSTCLTPEDAALVRQRAAAADRTIAAEIRVALKPYLAELAKTAKTSSAA